MFDPNTTTALVFAGGGSLGSIQVGMLRALIEAGLKPDFIVGSSIGAHNAAYFAGAPDLEGVRRLTEIWTGLRRADILPLSLSNLFGILRGTDSIVDPGHLRHLLETHLAFSRLEGARLPLHEMAADQQGVSVRLSSGPAVDAILASAVVPGIFPPVMIDGRPLMDGTIAANTPLHLAAKLGAKRVVVPPTGYACALKAPPPGIVAGMLHAVTLLIAWQLMHEIETMPASVDVHLAPTLCPLAESPYDFSATRQLIERANRNTKEWIGARRPEAAGTAT
jgi:NTE family protein